MYPLGAASLLALATASGGPTAPPFAYQLRPFDPASDQPHLEEICKNVYGGTDYLPSVASSLASDPLSTFVVLATNDSDDDDNRPFAAVANLRRFLPGKAWLEAVRTCETRRNRGLARELTQELIQKARDVGDEVMTCTVDSNIAMRKVLEGAGMRYAQRINQCSFEKMKELPGWGAGDEREALPLLQALEAEGLIKEESRKLEWELVESRADLDKALERIRARGGFGYLPGLWELLGDEVINASLRSGLILKLRGGEEEAVLTLFQDDKIQSLRSKWVCSVTTCSLVGLEAALWHACSIEVRDALGGEGAFIPAFDGSVPIDIHGSICKVLPLVENRCMVYSTEAKELI